MKLSNKSLCPHTLSRIFFNIFLFNQSNSSTQLKKNQNNFSYHHAYKLKMVENQQMQPKVKLSDEEKLKFIIFYKDNKQVLVFNSICLST